MHDRDAKRRRLSWMRLLCVVAVAAGAVAAGAGLGAVHAADYPTRPVRLFVPYGAGGVGDLTMRLLARTLGEQVGQNFVIENRPGAGGILSMSEVLRAAPDGYTIGEAGNGQAISASLFKKLPFDILKDFTPVSVTAYFQMMLAVPGNSPYRSLKDVVDAAKIAPGKLNLGAINPGSTQNLSAHLFEQVTGAQFTLVTYRTTPELVTAMLRGEVDLGFDYYAGFVSEIEGGKVRVIATSGEAREALLKDVPTAKEAGFPQYVVVGWNGIAVRSAVPGEVVNTLNAAINRALAAPELQEQARRLGLDARGSTLAETRARFTADIAKWRDVIDKAGIEKQ
jgi:tripartite-type tricarboxylate transporter receptor subunit TctC